MLHFYFPDEYREIGKEIEMRLTVPRYFPYIGRAEDLVKVVSVKWEKCKIEMKDNGFLKTAALISEYTSNVLNLRGVPYKMTSYYRYIPVTAGKDTKIIRDFDWINVQYLESGSYFESETSHPIWIDEEGDFIWWSMPNPIPEINQKH